ncbi:MAG: isopentenyl-diphosphate Delta-isomerase [Myxococcota bacterium]
MSGSGHTEASTDLLILVDSSDNVIGHAAKAACHDGDGRLHRAFSIFIFNGRGELLLQQRSSHKRLWPGFWSNSCCSHPRQGERLDGAASRRLREELGLQASLRSLYAFEYQARFADAGSEHELCTVLVGRVGGTGAWVTTDPDEIAACRWVSPEDLDREIAEMPDQLTPWLKIEWQRLRADFADVIAAL